jgi:hypothetical protein
VEGSFADFPVPRAAAGYRLTYDVDASRILPVSGRSSTSWTFRSSGPRGTGSTPLPLLSVDYALPLDAGNHPLPSGEATFTVRQANGVPTQRITSFTLAASVDGGLTWTPVPVSGSGDVFHAHLPAGPSVSLRVTAAGSAGSGIDQTVIDAYRGLV